MKVRINLVKYLEEDESSEYLYTIQIKRHLFWHTLKRIITGQYGDTKVDCVFNSDTAIRKYNEIISTIKN